MTRDSFPPLLACILLITTTPLQAQDHSAHGHAAMEKSSSQDEAHQHHAATTHDATPPTDPIPSLTDADRAAAFPPLAHVMEHGTDTHWRVLVNRLEAQEGPHGTAQAWEGAAWIGGDTRRVWLRSDGERVAGHTESAHLEVLYGRSVSPWWDVVAGLRHDFAPHDGRTWAALGVQGMAPYRFEVTATVYAGESGRTAASVEVEYDLLLTNKWILQPLFEADWHGRDDASRGVGSGLSTLEAGVRMRYEVRRRFAPYVGYAWSRAYGRTADLRRSMGEPVVERGWVAGARIWF